MLNKDRIIELLKAEQPRLAAEFGVSRIGLFGSYAHGKPRDDSDIDIDLLIEFKRPIGLQFVDLAEHLETLLGQREDLVTPAGLQAIRT
jgi:uncharacterized protein